MLSSQPRLQDGSLSVSFVSLGSIGKRPLYRYCECLKVLIIFSLCWQWISSFLPTSDFLCLVHESYSLLHDNSGP